MHESAGTPPPFSPAAERYVSLATFRRDGTEVRTPVWTAEVDGRCFVFTAGDAGKVKRLRADSRARIARCGLRGRVRGPWRDVRAVLIRDPDLIRRVHRAFRRKYGWQMWLADAGARLAGRLHRRAVIEILAAGTT